MEEVLLSRMGENKDVIEGDKHKSIQHDTEHIIDLEHCGSVVESKRHYQVLIVFTSYVKGRLPIVSFAYPN